MDDDDGDEVVDPIDVEEVNSIFGDGVDMSKVVGERTSTMRMSLIRVLNRWFTRIPVDFTFEREVRLGHRHPLG
jgi:hypothetical protein